MKRIIFLFLVLCLLLSGCGGLFNGSYHSVTRHEEEDSQEDAQIVSVSNYVSLCTTLCTTIADGMESIIISVARYDQGKVETDMASAIERVITTDPIAAYAVKDIEFELGSNAGQPAVAVTIDYLHNRAEIRKIRHLQDREGVESAISDVLDNCDSGMVLYIQDYEEMDFAQWVSDYAVANPDKVMEFPAVTANIYPEDGEDRVVELKFLYQNSRESLRSMQGKVRPLFSAAAIYAGEDADTAERYFKLYSFLMGLFQTFQLDTSLTPAYSLLQHGVGDSKAFATVYAAMCEEAGLECIVVTGMRAGELRYWNIVKAEDVYYHVDLLACDQNGDFLMQTDEEMRAADEMTGYVWDYSAYPACGVLPTEEE